MKQLNVLKFYMAVNKLKKTKKGEHSKADSIFGSSILAAAFASEFNTTNDLGRIIKMELLYELSYIPDFFYDIKDMRLASEMKEIIMEFNSCKSPTAMLAHEYKSLDNILSSIADKSGNINEFLEFSLKTMNVQNDRAKYINILKFYYYNHILKLKTRTGWLNWNVESKNERIETDSDHTIGAIGLAYAFESEYDYCFDINEVLSTLLVHEIGEAIIGDITPFDNIPKEEKQEKEHRAMKVVLGPLSKSKELYQNLLDFDSLKNPIDRFAHYCDKLDTDIQSKIYQEKGFYHSLDKQENNVTMNSERVQKMISDGIAATPFDVWFFYDLPIYTDESMPEFASTLKFVRENELLKLNSYVASEVTDNPFYKSVLSELSYEINKLKKTDAVEAILLTRNNNSINLKVLYNEPVFNKSTKIDLSEYFIFQDLKGMSVTLVSGMINTHHREIHNSKDIESILNATVVFDRNGYIEELKKQAMKHFEEHKKIEECSLNLKKINNEE